MEDQNKPDNNSNLEEVDVISQLFVDAAMKPYNFYLCPPLDSSQRLVQMIRENGGNVVSDFLQNCIVISSKDFPVPDDLKTAHIYSYEVIQDSANRGAQQEFSHYLIHVPSINESIPHQFNTDKRAENPFNTGNNDENDEINVNEYDFSSLDKSLADEHQENNHTSLQFQNAIPNNETHRLQFDTGNIRYFTAEENKILFEEVRKRHWMGIRGHSIYEEISKLPYFVNRGRTPASLRERMRTVKFNIGYVYKLDKKHRPIKDENGNFLKTTKISSKLTPYTAADDLILSKTIYLKLDIVTDSRGFETVIFPTNFFDKFSQVYSSHSPESWRQRYKKYISIFGIANYLKYYIKTKKIDHMEPLPTNLANKEWLFVRNQTKKADTPRLYFPHVPQENDFIAENLEYTNLPEFEGKIFEFTNPFKSIVPLNKKRKYSNDEDSPAIQSTAESSIGINDHSKDESNAVSIHDNINIDIDFNMEDNNDNEEMNNLGSSGISHVLGSVSREDSIVQGLIENINDSQQQLTYTDKELDVRNTDGVNANTLDDSNEEKTLEVKNESFEKHEKESASHTDLTVQSEKNENGENTAQIDQDSRSYDNDAQTEKHLEQQTQLQAGDAGNGEENEEFQLQETIQKSVSFEETTLEKESEHNISAEQTTSAGMGAVDDSIEHQEQHISTQTPTPVLEPLMVPEEDSQQPETTEESSNLMPTGASVESPEVFIDEPTTFFEEQVFIKQFNKLGKPIELDEIENKAELVDKIYACFERENFSPKELAKRLLSCSVKKYYTVYLIYRCNSDWGLVYDSLINYIETEGRELLAMKPGCWSNKSMQWIDQHDERLNELLRQYHGDEKFEKQIAALKKTKVQR